MSASTRLVAALAAMAMAQGSAWGADDGAELQRLRTQLQELQKDYDARLKALEQRLQRAEAAQAAQAAQAAPSAAPPVAAAAPAPAVAAAATPPPVAAPATAATSAPTAANAFNPALSLILSGGYGSFSQDPQTYHISGFLTGDEIGPGVRGFSLGESELGISASVDPWFSGSMNLSVESDNSVSVEEAYVDTTALPGGLRLRAGRFLSAIGYENSKHAHTWDFVDAPLVYQAFLNGALQQDGVQLSALLPTDRFIELGAGLGAGGPYPSSGDNRSKPGTATLFAHTGGDVGLDSSWRAGASLLWASADGRESDAYDAGGTATATQFSGTSRTVIVDGIWKWAPNGNPQRTNFKLQGEYFWRNETGALTYDPAAAAVTDRYRAVQGGWYGQAVYQFMPAWRLGARYDRLNIGNVDAGANDANLFLPGYSPSRATVMLDWSPSEFSRWRLQYANDRARYGLTDNQWLVQYQVSLGSHGAHDF